MCKCNKTITNTTCNSCNPTPCTPTSPCDCSAGYMSSDCVNDIKTEFTCFDIDSHQTLTETLSQMEEETCSAIENVRNMTILLNVGIGAIVA
jgi:hypothetical protein